ncbi:PAS domain-containing sensor histidine kinase [bacterium]|nr:PAS domain-containing sensor histidine kinase [bacterium]
MLMSLVPTLLLFVGMSLYAFKLLSDEELGVWRNDARAIALSVLPLLEEEGRVRLPTPENPSEAELARRERIQGFLATARADRAEWLTHVSVISCIDYKPIYHSPGGDAEALPILDQGTTDRVLTSREMRPIWVPESSSFLVPLRSAEDTRTRAFLQVGVRSDRQGRLAERLWERSLVPLAAILAASLLLSWMLFRSMHGNALDPIAGVLAKANAGYSDKRVDLSRCNPDLVPLATSINMLLDLQVEQYQRLLEYESREEEMANRLKLFREETGDRLRHIERERENLEVRWQTLRDTAPVGIAVLDLRAGQLLEHNTRARRMFRIEDEDGAFRAPVDLLRGVEKALGAGGETAEALLSIFDPILHQMRPVRVRMRRLDPSRAAGSDRILLVLEDQEPLQKFELVKNEFYEHVKASFARPLSRIAELLSAVRAESFDPAALDELSALSASLEGEIKRLLDLEATAPAPRQKSMIELDLAALLAHSARLVGEKHPGRHCRVHHRIGPGGGLVLADPDDLSRILVSLFELVLEWRVDLMLEVEITAREDSVLILAAGTPSPRSNSLFDIKPAGTVEGAEQDATVRRAWMMRLSVLATRLEAYGGTLNHRLVPQRNRLEVAVSLPRLAQSDPGSPQDMVGRLVRSFLQG